jgi:hypothetical protein
MVLRRRTTNEVFGGAFDQGCQISLGSTYQNGENITNGILYGHFGIFYGKMTENISNGHKIYQMVVKYTKWPYM